MNSFQKDDFDFAINFDINFFIENDAEKYLLWTRNKTIYINDGMDLLRPWISHVS